ncbi:MAG TPA: HAD family phosphatase [Pseudonocardia sp.]
MTDTAVLDIDGTLVDTNYHHALAWFRAFRRFDVTLPVWKLHRAIGMGGDQLVGAVAGKDFEEAHGDDARAAWSEEFTPLLPEIVPFDGVQEVLGDLHDRGLKVVLASSGNPDQIETYLKLIDGHRLADAWTTSEDVSHTKPAPDLISVAVEKVGGKHAVVIGDSVWDFVAAKKAGHVGYAIRSGGFSDAELCDAGARDVFDSMVELRGALDRVLS